MTETTTEDHIQAILAGDFWVTDYIKLSSVPVAFKTYKNLETDKIRAWVKQFLTNKNKTVWITHPVCSNNYYDLDVFVILELSFWQPAAGPPNFHYALTKECNGEFEVWFGRERIESDKNVPDYIKLALNNF